MESQKEVEERLKRYHGRPIDMEMGGKVAVNEARLLLKILEAEPNGRTGFEIEGKKLDDITERETKCVDLSDYFVDLEPHEV